MEQRFRVYEEKEVMRPLLCYTPERTKVATSLLILYAPDRHTSRLMVMVYADIYIVVGNIAVP